MSSWFVEKYLLRLVTGYKANGKGPDKFFSVVYTYKWKKKLQMRLSYKNLWVKNLPLTSLFQRGEFTKNPEEPELG